VLLIPVTAGGSEEFDRFVGSHVHGDPLQGACFGDLQAERGRTVHRFYLVEHGHAVGSLSLIAAEVGRLGQLLYAPRGPVLDPGQRVAWRSLAWELRHHFPRAFAFTCAPRIDERQPRPPGYFPRRGVPLDPGLSLAAVELPLSGDPERDFARLHRRCRVQLRRAPAHGVSVREARRDEVRLALGLMRRGPAVIAPDPAALADALAAFRARGQAALFLAEEAGAVRAASVVIRLGRHALCQHLGQDDGGRHRAAGYAAQWAAIAWAEGQGAERCDITGFRAPGDPTLADVARRYGGIEHRYALLEVPMRLGPYLAYRLLPAARVRKGLGAGAAAPAH